MKQYKTDFKLQVVQSFLSGEGGAKLPARRWSAPEEKIRTWVSHYRLHGVDGFLRTTGATVESTVGVIGPCPTGIAWMSAAMIAAKSKPGGGADPDKGGANVCGLSICAVFEALAELRPGVEDPNVITEAIKAAAGTKPRSKLASAWRGVLAPFNGDHSTAGMFICSEAVRRGGGHVEDVVAVWRASGLSDREKFKRKDYRARTIEAAARAVMLNLRAKASESAGRARRLSSLSNSRRPLRSLATS